MVSNVVRMIRNGFVSNVSPNDRYSSCSDCRQRLLRSYRVYRHGYCILHLGNCVRLEGLRKHGKAYVRYREFIRKVWLIRHGYVMIREYFRKVRQRFGFQSASTYISSAPNRHEWLIWRENVEICVWFGGFAWLYPSHTYTTHSPRLQ